MGGRGGGERGGEGLPDALTEEQRAVRKLLSRTPPSTVEVKEFIGTVDNYKESGERRFNHRGRFLTMCHQR